MLEPIRTRTLPAFLRIAFELSVSGEGAHHHPTCPSSSRKGTPPILFRRPIIASMGGSAGSSTTTTWRRFAAAHAGDRTALATLVARCIPALRRWSHGRLPRWARSVADTVDLVHDAVLHTILRADGLDLRSRRDLARYL